MLPLKHLLHTGLLLMCMVTSGISQNIDLEKIGSHEKKKFFIPSGSISASNIFYSGNGGGGRLPYTYYLNGFLNINIAGLIDMPFAFSLTNVGAGFSYPVAPSQLSLHPKYKSVTAHIGDVSMAFSPYTLNGHLFRGAGLDYNPQNKPLKISVMGGRLQKAVEYDSTNRLSQAAYQRFGYGAKISYEKKLFTLGMIAFAAKDAVNSLQFKPDSLQIFPKQNVVISWNGKWKPIAGLEVSAEYATNALTTDLRDTSKVLNSRKNVLSNFIEERNSTSFYKAVKADLRYVYKTSNIGVGYERIDPGYETLGAYYFNNDLQNITVNFGQLLLKGKARIDANIGFQYDDLEGTKAGSNQRTIMSYNLSYTPNEKLMATGSYSNFTSYMHIKPLFQVVNQLTPYQDLDTLKFSQITQNANLFVNYLLNKAKRKTHNLNINLTFLDVADKRGDIKSENTSSNFYNAIVAYGLMFDSVGLNINTALNYSRNTIGSTYITTFGPTVSANVLFFKRRITAGLSTSYNTTQSPAQQGDKILNVQFFSSYVYHKRHRMNLSVLHQTRDIHQQNITNDVVATLGYNFSF